MTTLIEIIRAPWAWYVAGPLIGLMVPALSSASARRTPEVAHRDMPSAGWPTSSFRRSSPWWVSSPAA